MGCSRSGVALSSSSCLLIFFFLPHLSLSVSICKPASCNEMGWGPQIRFPFRLKGIQDQSCGYPGFDLSCEQGQTILSLPHSGEFIVKWINYSAQTVYINDPDECLPRRISNFSAAGSSFRAAANKKYTFFNCSLGWPAYETMDHVVPLLCNYDYNSTILVTPTRYSSEIPPSCRLIRNASIPLQLSYTEYMSETFIGEDLALEWDQPAGCRSCEERGLYCGLKNNFGLDVGCGRPPGKGLRRGAKYGIIIGIGIPALVFLMGLAFYTCHKVRDFGRRRSLNSTELSTAGMSLPPASVMVTGLDALIIESYPKTVIGESRRLPNPGDGTCPICLAEYQPKETLRTIPECNHYFHASCVDEWLKLNRTCPLCRNSPESMSTTPCSSTASTFSPSSSA